MSPILPQQRRSRNRRGKSSRERREVTGCKLAQGIKRSREESGPRSKSALGRSANTAPKVSAAQKRKADITEADCKQAETEDHKRDGGSGEQGKGQ